MKPSINKFVWCIGTAALLAACSEAPEPPSVKRIEEPAPAPVALPLKTEVKSVQATPKPVPVKKVSSPIDKPAADFSADQLAEKLKAWDRKLDTLSTGFEQTTSYDGVLVSRSSGHLYYNQKANLLRLDTFGSENTVEQTAVTNKKKILILDEQGNEVTQLSWADWQQGQPNQALFDFGNYTALLGRHTASIKTQNGDEAVLLLMPKDGNETYKLYITISKADFFPTKIAIESELMLTQASLRDTHKNKLLAENTFGGFFK